jgi:hypothetical protein
MKRENLSRAITLDREIKKHESMLEDLNGVEKYHVKIYINNLYYAAEIHTTGSDTLSAITSDYIEAVKIYCETEIDALTNEMEAL